MSIDLIIQSNTKAALYQWLGARGLGTYVQITDPEASNFGDWIYEHTDPASLWVWWNEPSGVVTASIDATDPDNPVATNYTGFFGLLKLRDADALDSPRYETNTVVIGQDEFGNDITEEQVTELPSLKDWVSTSTAVVSSQGLAGVGGEGIVIFDPEDLRAAVQAGGAPLWDGLLGVGNQWSDPRLWAFSAVMTGDQREFGEKTYESLIDFNVWSPSQYPAGWQEVEATEPEVQPWVQPTGAQDAYPLGAIVTHNGQTWENTGSPANVWAPGVFGWEVV
jgi:hypothetical protein